MKSLKNMMSEKELTLIASLPSNDLELAKGAIAGGADVIKVHLNVEHRASGTTFGSLEDNLNFLQKLSNEFTGPIGIVPGGNFKSVNKLELKKLIEIGFSYYSIYMKHMPSYMLGLDMEKTVAGDSSFDLQSIRSLNNSVVDAFEASIIPGEEYGTPLCFEDLLNYQSIVETLDIPVIVPTQRKVTADDIPYLKSTGIKALMAGAVVTGETAISIEKTLKDFKKQM